MHTKESINQTPVELGATWFTSQHRYLINLLEEVTIKYFKQYMEGTSFYQPYSTSPADTIILPSQSQSYRISGGTFYLIQTLRAGRLGWRGGVTSSCRHIKAGQHFLNDVALGYAMGAASGILIPEFHKK